SMADLVVAPDGNVLVGEPAAAAPRVEVFDAAGHYVGSFGARGYGPGQMELPYGLAMGAEGDVLLADSTDRRIERWTESP
ncbi:MAG: hypothetical protein KGJ43_08425, partial [Acidobacteriota bacterium]|nr:hypothetical protein [Acidobacteriota bacterium]